MFKLWKKKEKEGTKVKAKPARKVALCACAAALLACVTGASLMIGINASTNNSLGGNTLNTGIGGNTAGSTSATATSVEKFDAEYILKDADGKTKAQIWDEAVDPANVGKKIKVTMAEDWTAITDGTIFGVAAQTGPSNLLESPKGNLIIPNGIDLTLDMDGHTINRGLAAGCPVGQTENGNVIFVYGTLTITGNGVITGGNTEGNGGGINGQPNSTVILNGVTITGNVAWCGGGILARGTLVINDATITGNHATAYNRSVASGGGIFLYHDAIFTMNGGEISGNEATYQGGGVALRAENLLATGLKKPTFTMNGGSITGNKCTYSGSGTDGGGAGVSATYGATFILNNGKIENNKNTVNGSGGGVKVEYDGLFEMNGGSVSGNQGTGGPGGGILAENGGKVTVNGGTILNNAAGAGCGGGGIFMRNGSNVLKFNGGYVNGNTCDGMGGGIAIMGDTSATFSGGVITGNTCSGLGDGIAASSSKNIELCGPLICYGNGTRDLRLDSGIKINVTGDLVKDGQSAWIGVAAYDATNGYAFTNGFGPAGRNEGYYASQFFFANGGGLAINSTYTPGSDKEAKFENDNLRDWRTVKWYYEVNGSWIQASEQNIRLTYGTKITNVKAEYVNADSSVVSASTQFVSTSGSANQYKFYKAEGKTANGSLISYRGTGNVIEDVGNYTFTIDIENTFINGIESSSNRTFLTNPTFNLQIEPKPITVTVGAQSGIYGESYDLVAGCGVDDPAVSVSSLGLTLVKSYGSGVGTYSVSGTGWTNKNYEVTFVSGTYEITKRQVTVIVNNAEAEYGKKSYTLNKDKNDVAEKAVGDITTVDGKQVDSEGYLVDSDGDRIDASGNKIYNGGWRYADGSKEFVSGDCNASTHTYPIELSSSVETAGTGYIAVDGYDINAKCVNPNYDLKVLNADGSAPAGGILGKGTFEVTKADIEVMSGTNYKRLSGNAAYDSSDYTGSAVTIAIPTAGFTGTDSNTYANGAVILKGDATVGGMTYRIFDGDGKSITNTSESKPEETPKADDTSFWGSSDTQITDADSYTVYVKITAANHNDLVYVFTYSLGAQKTALTITAKWGSNVIKSTDTGLTADASKAVYDGTTKLATDVSYANADANDVNCPLLVYYKNTSTDKDGNWKWGAWDNGFTVLDADDSVKSKFSDDLKHHKDYGTTEAPVNGGTYIITVVLDPTKKTGFSIDGVNSLSGVVVNAKEIAVPAGPSTNPVYNGTEQDAFTLTYNTAAVKVKSFAGSTGYGDLTEGTKKTSGANTQQTYKATDAGKYAVVFELTDTDNYKWKDKTGSAATAEQKVELTLDKKAVKVTFNPPDANATSKWTWKPNTYTDKFITYEIDEDSLCADPSDSSKKEAVTVVLNMCKKPEDGASAEPIITYIVTDDITGLEKINVTKIGTGVYYVYVTLESADENAVNKNYVIELDEETGLPKTEKQTFTVGDGEVDLSVLGWVYSYTYDGTPVDPAAYKAGELAYKLNPDGSKVAYTVEIDTDEKNGFPEYLDASKITYSGNEETDAGEHTLTVTLHIKSGSDYKFENKTGTDYKYVSPTEATYEFKWNIEKGKIDLSELEWGYKVDGGEAVKFKAPADGVYEVDVQNGLLITPVIVGGYNDKIVEIKEYSGDGTAEGAPVGDVTADGTTLTTTVTFKLLDTNFEQPEAVELKWRVTVATLEITGWETGTVKDKDGVPYKTPVVTGPDENLADKVKYVYVYNGEEYEGVEGLKELYKLADDNDEQLKNVTVKVLPADTDSYRLDETKGESFFEKSGATIGEAGIRLTVDLSSTGGAYGEAELTVTVNNKSTGKEAPSSVYSVYVYETDKDGEIIEESKKLLKDISVKTLNSGTYVIAVETKTGYVVAAGQNYLKFTVDKKELDLPNLAANPVFNGKEIEITDLLENYDERLMTLSGQGAKGNGE
ncbi:MAG: hypothetical protein K2I30_01900, partial [Clostridia bacterium]|nr:hypothetical protein [Clostridia bacterium]